MLLAISLFSSCSKSSAEPPSDEIIGPKETVVLPMLDGGNTQVGSVYIDNMNSGRAQARIALYNGHYNGENLKANVTLSIGSATHVYATCTDVDGKTGKCNTFPIKRLSDNIDATFTDITRTDGIVFNVLDANGNIIYRTAKYVVILHQ